jgi:hypothetical protein
MESKISKQTADAEWQAILARTIRIRAQARELASKDRPMRFRHPDGTPQIVTKSTDTPGEWRTTWFNKAGEPTGHTEWRTAYEAFFDCLVHGFVPIESSQS